jgi:hypothetical protein
VPRNTPLRSAYWSSALTDHDGSRDVLTRSFISGSASLVAAVPAVENTMIADAVPALTTGTDGTG